MQFFYEYMIIIFNNNGQKFNCNVMHNSRILCEISKNYPIFCGKIHYYNIKGEIGVLFIIINFISRGITYLSSSFIDSRAINYIGCSCRCSYRLLAYCYSVGVISFKFLVSRMKRSELGPFPWPYKCGL